VAMYTTDRPPPSVNCKNASAISSFISAEPQKYLPARIRPGRHHPETSCQPATGSSHSVLRITRLVPQWRPVYNALPPQATQRERYAGPYSHACLQLLCSAGHGGLEHRRQPITVHSNQSCHHGPMVRGSILTSRGPVTSESYASYPLGRARSVPRMLLKRHTGNIITCSGYRIRAPWWEAGSHGPCPVWWAQRCTQGSALERCPGRSLACPHEPA
jgi:hypothetical protein